MIRIALTGSIATGKSTVARQFAACGLPVYDADAAVHTLLQRPGPVRERVIACFPEAIRDGQIDRGLLGARVFHEAEALATLEAILHPAVRQEERAFEQRLRRMGRPAFVAEIPLLFETGSEARFDLVIMTSCPAWLQRQRAFARPRMHEEKYQQILARQMPTHEKRKRADVEIHTGLGKAASWQQVYQVIHQLGLH